MSNVVPQPITNLIEVREGLCDFTEPAFTVLKPSNLKAININQTNTFSNSAISAKLEIPNEFNIVDKNILWTQKMRVKITGNSVDSEGNPSDRALFEVGCIAPRSNPLSKIVNTITLTFGGSSYSMVLGQVVDMMERYNVYASRKYQSSLTPTMLDTATDYDALQNTSRNPLNAYKDGSGDEMLPRGSYMPVDMIKNTSTYCEFDITLNDYLQVAPLSSNITRQGGQYGLSHLTSLNLDLTLFSGALGQRLFSIARFRSGGNTVNITNIDVQLDRPIFRFITLNTTNDVIPNLVYYPLKTIERQPATFNLPYGVPTTVSSPVLTLSRVPVAVLFSAKPTQNVVQFNNTTNLRDGSQYSDSFTRCDNVNIQFDGQALLTNSNNQDLYKMSSENGLVDNYQLFAGNPLVNGMSAVSPSGDYLPTSFSPSGSCVKLCFGKDISLRRNLAPMVSYRTNFQITATFTNFNKNVETFDFVLVMMYDNVLALFDSNLSAISYAPLSEADAINAHKMNNAVHSDYLRSEQLNGGGFMDGINKFLHHAKVIYPHLKNVFQSELGKKAREAIKSGLSDAGHSKVSGALNAVGFGKVPKHALLR